MFLFGLHPSLVDGLHRTIKNQLPLANLKVPFSKPTRSPIFMITLARSGMCLRYCTSRALLPLSILGMPVDF